MCTTQLQRQQYVSISCSKLNLTLIDNSNFIFCGVCLKGCRAVEFSVLPRTPAISGLVSHKCLRVKKFYTKLGESIGEIGARSYFRDFDNEEVRTRVSGARVC